MIDVRGIHASLRIYTHLFRANQIDSSFLFLPLFFLPSFFIFIFISFFPLLFFFFCLIFGSFISIRVGRLFVSRLFHRQNNLSSVVSSTQDFVALNCYQPRMTLVSAPCYEQAFVSTSPTTCETR